MEDIDSIFTHEVTKLNYINTFEVSESLFYKMKFCWHVFIF